MKSDDSRDIGCQADYQCQGKSNGLCQSNKVALSKKLHEKGWSCVVLHKVPLFLSFRRNSRGQKFCAATWPACLTQPWGTSRWAVISKVLVTGHESHNSRIVAAYGYQQQSCKRSLLNTCAACAFNESSTGMTSKPGGSLTEDPLDSGPSANMAKILSKSRR